MQDDPLSNGTAQRFGHFVMPHPGAPDPAGRTRYPPGLPPSVRTAPVRHAAPDSQPQITSRLRSASGRRMPHPGCSRYRSPAYLPSDRQRSRQWIARRPWHHSTKASACSSALPLSWAP
jgi:hypothetical protein